MIDFHTHILPNIDDGARNVEETFNLIKEARNVGFKKIITTSHYMERYYEIENKEREIWIDSVSQSFRSQNINMELYLGSEIYITENIIKLLEDEKATTINNTSYVLFELPLSTDTEPMNLYDVIFEMLKYKLVPILAHPERYTFVQKNPDIIYDLLQKGVLMQANYGSIIGQYGKKAQIIVKKLLQNNMVQFLGTDVHRQGTVYPRMPIILRELENLIGKERLKKLTTTNAELALSNKKIEIANPKMLRFSFREKMIMNLKDR